jgi:RNA polymerase-interacting CarD/CdnL/TRCF family regulator
LGSGEIVKVAEAVRDLAWRREKRRRFTIRGKRLYDRGMALLAGEVASVQESDLEDAEILISEVLDRRLRSASRTQ